MQEMLYDEGTSTYGMVDSYRLRVAVDEDAHGNSPLTWNEWETKDGWAYRQWAAGHVYIVFVEKEETYAHTSDPDRTITQWEVVDAVGSCYLTPGAKAEDVSEYSALDVARDHGFEGVQEYRVERITSHDGNYERRTGQAKPTIAEALEDVAPEGNAEGFNAYTSNLKGDRRARVVADLRQRGRSGHGWVDFILHTNS